MSTLGPQYVGPTSGFFSPNYPQPVLFSCLSCKVIRENRQCPCGQSGCWFCHIKECSIAAAVERDDQQAWRRGTSVLPESRSPRPTAELSLSVRRVGIRRA